MKNTQSGQKPEVPEVPEAPERPERPERRKHRILKRILLALLILLVLLEAACGIYLSRYHSGDETALALLETPSAGVTVEAQGNTIAFIPEGEIQAGIVFYPGAKLRGDAYTPLADALAENGYLCVLVNMPLNLAALDSDAALEVEADWPEVTAWYIAGHSMGGLAAEQCASENPEDFCGVIVLASRIQYDFSGINLPVLAIYATCDGICSPEVVAKAKETYPEPENYTEVTIAGGCHGNFGSYGHQFMDGTPNISWEEQQQQTLAAILSFLAA